MSTKTSDIAATFLLISLIALIGGMWLSGCGRSQDCAFISHGFCIERGEFSLNVEITDFTLEEVGKEVSNTYNVNFDIRDLGREYSPSVFVDSFNSVKDICENERAGGCYFVHSDLIFIGHGSYSEESYECADHHYTLLHETLHFLSNRLLKEKKPELYKDKGFMETESSHTTKYMWMNWASENNFTFNRSIEGRLSEKIVQKCNSKYRSN